MMVEMASKRKACHTTSVQWSGGKDRYWIVSGGVLTNSIFITPELLRVAFPTFYAACVEFLKSSELVENEQSLLGCAAHSFTEIEQKRKRYQVYRSLALLLEYSDRTKLPKILEKSVKATWFDPGEAFVGYRDPE